MPKPIPFIRDTLLVDRRGEHEQTLTVGTPEWYAWLTQAEAFAFTSPGGTFTARKEQAGNRRGGWCTYYNLEMGQRTPAFLLEQKNITVVSWYLRLDGTAGTMPGWGIVRLEIPEKFFSQQLQRDWSYIDALSRMICEYRCKDKSYERASVSLYPIQRAEEILGATMTGGDQIVSRFYNLTQL